MRARHTGIWLATGVLLAALLAEPRLAGAQVGPLGDRDGVREHVLADARRAARYSGRGVLVFFREDWCGHCEQLEKLLAHRNLRDITRRFILVKLTLHENPALAHEYKVVMHHQVIMLDWSGRIVGRITEFERPRDVARQLRESAAANDLHAAEKLCRLGYYGRAAKRLGAVVKTSRNKETVGRARKELTRIREQGTKRLDLIKQLIRAGRLDEAAEACREFIDNFPPDMGRGEAEKLLAKLKSGVRIVLPGAEAVTEDKPDKTTPAEEAKRLLEQGMVYEWDTRFYRAVRSYERITTLYANTPAAEEATERLQALLEDPEMRERVAKQKMDYHCKRWLEMGRLYEKNKRDDLAVKYYNTVTTFYPDSAYAAEARKRLTGIERRNPETREK